MDKDIANEFRSLSTAECQAASNVLPSDPMTKLALFVEATRVLDYRSVLQPLLPEDRRMAQPDFDMVHAGWNMVAAQCLSRVEIDGAFPMMESTEQSRQFAITLLHQFGRSVLMRRVADMVAHGFLLAEPTSRGFTLRKSAGVDAQFVDNLEFDQLRSFENFLRDSNVDLWQGWKVRDHSELSELTSEPGSFLSRQQELLKGWRHPDIDSLMLPLIRPWDSTKGTMMGYDALPEVDNHFLAVALDFMDDCRNEFGIHPDTALSTVTGAELTAVATFIVSLHLKHIRFALLAMKQFPEISIPQSLTIWTPRDKLVADMADWSGMSLQKVDAAMSAITLSAPEAAYLQRLSLPQVPLLISLENNVVVRPVASITRNPFIATSNLLASRDIATRDALRSPREEWLRRDLYAMFYGSRYACVQGSVKLREGSKTVTDIDAAILDRTSGHLALFQLKWQDYFTNDVRELRSRASNLTRELDDWAEKVTHWLESRTAEEIEQTLQINRGKNGPVFVIWLFALSRTAARVHGYGFTAKDPKLAVANWPHFVRARREIGPVEEVFPKIHQLLQEEAFATVQPKPIPVEWKIAGKVVHLQDLWSVLPDTRLESSNGEENARKE